MSRRRTIERHLRALGEIREIMNAMKNLALMETHKLTRRLDTQRRVVASIEAAAADFLSFYPHLPGAVAATREVHLLIGSERGFCGDFNEALATALRKHATEGQQPALLMIGSKLASRHADDPDVIARLAGPSALEEVEAVLLNLMATLEQWQATQQTAHALRFTIFHHLPEEPGVKVTRLDPFGQETPPQRFAYPPLLNLEPESFLTKLAEHYLLAALHELFYCSLMAENQQRVQRMDSAVRRIDDESQVLLRRSNSLRQEEITEEIELIMLNIETPAKMPLVWPGPG